MAWNYALGSGWARRSSKARHYHLLPEGIALPPFVPQGFAIHNVHEFTNLASFLPEIYRENEGKMFE